MTDDDARELLAAENLARTEALRVLKWRRGEAARAGARALVLAGRAGAGACAMAAARHLANYGIECRVAVCGPSHRILPAASAQLRILSAMGVRVEEPPEAGRVAALVGAADARTALVDGAGDTNAPGVEQDFAAAARVPSGAGLTVRLDPARGYLTPRPEASDATFSPETPPRSREDVRLMDSTAINDYGIPGLALMENAGWRTAREAYAMLDFAPGDRRVVVVAGAGNNGGDGMVAARHLAGWGVAVEAVLVGARDRILDDAGTNLTLARDAGIGIREAALPELVDASLPDALATAALVVDALVGTGLSGRIRGAVARAVDVINASSRPVLAVDTPSGLDANTGAELGAAVRARRTVTFAFPKPGFFLGAGPACVGELVVADISLPRALWASP